MAVLSDREPETEAWTHKELVKRMTLWIKYCQHMGIVISELSTGTSETPDIIAWGSGACSMLIECKISRQDFLSDRKKRFRENSTEGVGDRRYYAAPRGLIKIEELPHQWGLFEVKGRDISIKKEAEYQQTSKRHECVMLMSVVRRLKISTAVYVVHDSDNPKGEGKG